MVSTSEVEGLGDSGTVLLQKLRDWVIQGLYYCICTCKRFYS